MRRRLLNSETPGSENAPNTLGDVLATHTNDVESEANWVALVESIAAGDQSSLHALYERAHGIVFTLTMRITRNRQTAEELTLDVFHDVWRRASTYDVKNGTVLGWIMNQARSRAIDRLRFERRKKRVDPFAGTSLVEPSELQDFLEQVQQNQAMQCALADAITPDERQAIEASFLAELTHAEVAAKLHQPLGTVKTRIRSALLKLRRAMVDDGHHR